MHIIARLRPPHPPLAGSEGAGARARRAYRAGPGLETSRGLVMSERIDELWCVSPSDESVQLDMTDAVEPSRLRIESRPRGAEKAAGPSANGPA